MVPSLFATLWLLIAPPSAGACAFQFDPIGSGFGARLDALTPWLLLDYSVPMPYNLEMVPPCQDLWALHFGGRALSRMAGAAGGGLAPLLRDAAAQVAFVDECGIQDPSGCVRMAPINASRLLWALRRHWGALRGRPPRYPGCERLRCTDAPPPDPPPLSPPPLEWKTPTPPPPFSHGVLLLGGLGGVGGAGALAWALWKRPCTAGGGTGNTGRSWGGADGEGGVERGAVISGGGNGEGGAGGTKSDGGGG